MIDRLFRALFGIFIGAWVARYLGPTQFGSLTFCIAFVAIFQTIVSLGLDAIVVREIAKKQNEANEFLGSALFLRLLTGMLCWVISTTIFAELNSEDNSNLLLMMIVGATLIFQPSDTIDLWFQSQSKNQLTVIAKLCASLISGLIKIILIVNQAPLISFAIATAVESFLVMTALYLAYQRFSCGLRWTIQAEKCKLLILESWPYLVSSLGVLCYMRFDQILINKILGPAELGLYAAILPISNIWNGVAVVLFTSIAPFMAKKKEQGDNYFYSTLLVICRIYLCVSIIICIFTMVLAPFLIRIIFGNDYVKASEILQIYVFTNIPIFLGIAQSIWIINFRKTNIIMLQTLMGAISSVIGNLSLIPIYGLKGAAITAVLSQLISAVLINVFFSKKIFFMQLGIKTKLE